MVFNTGAALLDAIVLAVVSEEKEGTLWYKITQEVGPSGRFLSLPFISPAAAQGRLLEVYDMEYGGRKPPVL